MPKHYAKYRDALEPYLGKFAGDQNGVIDVAPGDTQPRENTLGGSVILDPSLHLVPGFPALYDVFVKHSADFVWDPSGKGAYTVDKVLETLDGDRKSGECKILAAALFGLWVFPLPFGLGHDKSHPRAAMKTFNNANLKDGFISHHPLDGVRGLGPNIKVPGSSETLQPLYQWADHKVIDYNGKLWDPSYMHIWDDEKEMVAFQFHGAAPKDPAGDYHVKVITPSAPKGWLKDAIMKIRFDMRTVSWRGPSA